MSINLKEETGTRNTQYAYVRNRRTGFDVYGIHFLCITNSIECHTDALIVVFRRLYHSLSITESVAERNASTDY